MTAREFPQLAHPVPGQAGTVTAAGRPVMSQPRWTNWKNPSSARSAASWNRPAWRDRETPNRFSKSCGAPRRLVATIPAPAAPGKNTRSAAAPKAKLSSYAESKDPYSLRAARLVPAESLARLYDQAVLFVQ